MSSEGGGRRLVGVCMIVKNEEAVLERCLRSTLSFADSFLIVDTGSTDGTISLIRRVAKELGKEGTVVERPWKNFGHNRTEALELFRQEKIADWALMIDADDNFEGDPEALKRDILAAEANGQGGIHANLHHGNSRFTRPQLFRSSENWHYIGAIHEYAHCEPSCSMRTPPTDCGYHFVVRCEGARSQDPQKYAKDAAVLLEEYAKDPANSRTVFYLAQSLLHSGQGEAAKKYYKERALMGGWREEVYVSVLNLVQMGDMSLLWSVADIMRLEVATEALRQKRTKDDFSREIYAFACQYKKVTAPPPRSLFVRQDVYDWKFHDELSVCAYYLGDFKQSYKSALRAYYGCPPESRERVGKNIDFALKNMKKMGGA
jgi:glycosyltransferase involved in cell wall biosynthesis